MKAKIIILILTLLIFNHINTQEIKTEKPELIINTDNNCQLRYVYFPNLCAYFDNVELVYIFQEKGVWVTRENLPILYGGYTLFSNVRVIIPDFDEENPQTHIKNHKKQFPYSAKGRFTYVTATID